MDALNNEQSATKVAKLVDLSESFPSQTETTQHVDKGHYGGKLAEKLNAADLAFSSGRQKTNISRSQAEESYQRALEEVNIYLEKVEKEVALATKTKWEIKEAVKDLGRSFRDLLKADKQFGRAQPTDTVDQRLRTVQQQQQLQHTNNKELHQQQREQLEQIKEIMEAMQKKQEEQQFQIQEMLESQQNQFTLLKQRPETGGHTQQQKIGVETRTGVSDEDGKNDKPKDDTYKIGNIIGTKDTDGNSEWQVVKRRGSSGTSTKDRVTAKRERQRPPAILVKVGKSSYSEVLRKLKTGTDVKSAAGNVQNIRKTQAGDLLVELQRHSQDSTLLVEAISKVMEDSGAVKALEQMEKIAILDMDEQVEEDDIVESLGATYGISAAAIKVESLLSVSRGQKIGIVKVPIAMVAKVLDVGRLRVGYTNCRIRIWEKRKRCYKCLVLGHFAKECTGPDRSSLCHRCGNDDHKAVVCKSSRNKCEEFGIITKLRQAKPSMVEADQSILEDIERDPGRKDDIRQHDC